MATFLKHIPCGVCGSADNRGVWDDGSEWCFGCRSYTPPHGQAIVNNYVAKRSKPQGYKNVTLPEDALPYLPNHAKAWLAKYHLTKEELSELAPLYSFEKDLLIFPIYAQGELIMYQGRYFGDKPKHPKYLTYGAKDVLHILGDTTRDVVCVVEDIISAVRVASVIPAMPLFGSVLSLKDANRLSLLFSSLFVWLDRDKANESIKTSRTYAPLFNQTRSIITELDPKEYAHAEIQSTLF